VNENWFHDDQLHFAAQDGDAQRVAKLLSEGFKPNLFDTLGKTPLHYAVEKEHFEVVALLIENGADVNAHHLPSIGNTPLAEVAQTCSLKMAQVLVNAGADPTIRGWMQLNAIDRARQRKRGDGPRVYDLLLTASHLSS
jgi:ankyrin repeat protein